MKNKRKTITSISLDIELLEHIDSNPYIKNFSDWVSSKYKKEFLQIEEETDILNWHLKEINKCKERIKNIKKEKTDQIVSQEAIDWIKSYGIERTKRTTIEGVLKFFNNKFEERLNLRQFKILLKEEQNEK